MSVLSILAMTLGTMGALANSFQIYKIYKRKSAKDISAITYSIFLVSTMVWILYGIEIENLPILIPNVIAEIGNILILTGWFLYGRNSKK